MFNIFKSKISEEEKQVMLRDKLENNFIQCAQQSRKIRHVDLEKDISIMNSTLTISNISVMDGSDCIGWIHGISCEDKSDILVVDHIAMATNQTRKKLCKYMITGFSKAVKKQFPNINYIEFHELKRQAVGSAKAGHYTAFFIKCGMVPNNAADPQTPYTLIL